MNRGVLVVALLLLAVGVIGFQTRAYYEFERLFPRSPATVHPPNGNGGSNSNNNNSNSNGSTNLDSNSTSNYFDVNTIINYGNATIVWFNNTKVPLGWNFYNLTAYLTSGRVSVLYSDLYKENQVLGINGLNQTLTEYWSLWKFCPSSDAWLYSPVGADEIALTNGGIYGWYFQSYATTNPPVTGATTVLSFC